MSLSGFTKPTIQEIKSRIGSDIQAQFPELDANLKTSVLNVMGDTFTGMFYSLFGYLDYIASQSNILYATEENLDTFGSVWSIKRISATQATGTITLTGNDSTIIPSGTTIQTLTEIEYITSDDVTISGGSAIANVESIETGESQNQNVGTLLHFISPIPNVDAVTTVISIENGSETENDEALRTRLLNRINQAPHGGTKKDYVDWAKSQSDVTRAWCYPLENGDGTVVVRFMQDDKYVDGIPLAGDIPSLQNYIDDFRPVTASVTVVAPVAKPLNITITGLAPNTAEVKAIIEAEIKDMILRKSQPGGVIRLSWIYEAISIAVGESYHSLTSPVTDQTQTVTQIATLGTITYA